MDNKFVISLTTIPSRISTLEPVINSLLNQTYPPKAIYLNLPKKYNRFDEKIKIPIFLSKYDNVHVYHMDVDYGPATKFIGALLNPDISDDTPIMVTDDDTIKRHHWAQLLMSQYNNSRVTSFVEKKLGNNIVWGYLGYVFKKKLFNVNEMLQFYDKVKCDCILVDDHWLTGYCHYKNIPIHNIPIDTKEFINYESKGEYNDALVNISGPNNRLKVSEECRKKIKNEFDTEFPFWCCIGCCVNGKRRTDIATFNNNKLNTNNIYYVFNLLIIIFIVVILYRFVCGKIRKIF